MKALITGITGFAGSHLADYLLAHQPQVEIFGIRRWRSPMDNIAHLAEHLKLVDPRDLQARDVLAVNLVETAVTLRRIIAGIHEPVVGLSLGVDQTLRGDGAKGRERIVVPGLLGPGDSGPKAGRQRHCPNQTSRTLSDAYHRNTLSLAGFALERRLELGS